MISLLSRCLASVNEKLSRDALIDWFTELGAALRVGLSSPMFDEAAVAEARKHIDPDFYGWVRNDPMVAGNSASRYCDDSPGYLTRNGLGSLEIGAADD